MSLAGFPTRFSARLALLGCSLLCGTLAWAAPQDGLVAYRAVYSVHLDGVGVGTSHLTLKPGPNGVWICHSSAKPNALFGLFDSAQLRERSIFRIRQGHLEALSYTLTEPGRSAQHDQGVRFDWSKHRAYAYVGSKKTVFTVHGSVFDRLSAQIALSRDLVLHGRPPPVYWVINHNHMHHYRFVKTGTRRWRTPIGIFQTVTYVRHSRKGATLTFWCAPSLYEIPIVARQTRHGHPTITLHLIGFKRLTSSGTHQVLGKVTPR